MAILTSKEYVDAHGGGGGSVPVAYTKRVNITGVSPIDISTASTTSVETTLATVPALTDINSAKKYLCMASFNITAKGTATADSPVTLKLQASCGDADLVSPVADTAMVLKATLGVNETNVEYRAKGTTVLQGSDIKSQPIKLYVDTDSNVTGASLQIIWGALDLVLIEVTETAE